MYADLRSASGVCTRALGTSEAKRRQVPRVASLERCSRYHVRKDHERGTTCTASRAARPGMQHNEGASRSQGHLLIESLLHQNIGVLLGADRRQISFVRLAPGDACAHGAIIAGRRVTGEAARRLAHRGLHAVNTQRRRHLDQVTLVHHGARNDALQVALGCQLGCRQGLGTAQPTLDQALRTQSG